MPPLRAMLDFVMDELNIYLVQRHLKPSCFLGLTLLEHKESFETILKKKKLLFNAKEYNIELKRSIKEPLDSPPFMLSVKYGIGNSRENLERLVQAKSHEEMGLALGYPEEAAKSYEKIINGIKRNAAYVLVEMAKAVNAGIEIPSWLAYLSYAVEEIDLINGKVSPSSEKLGKEYQRYVRRHNPRLAIMVEDFFNKIELPDRWELAKSGEYEIKYPKEK
ncbi:MAG: hypothetical protein QME12_03425 [Nanoarchaeota archaeon]|nr:hypothetical protein [Nanoarchaeota archaeon]